MNKQFTKEQIDRGIEKLNRRIVQVEALDPAKVRFDDAIVDNVEHDIIETIREVFGLESPEFRSHQYHRIWKGGFSYIETVDEQQRHFVDGIQDTLMTLQGLITWLEEKRTDLDHDSSEATRAAFEDIDIHPRIAGVCRDLYRNGHYPNAVFDASKALVNFVKEKSGRHDLDGAPLMRTAFSKNDPILAFNDLSDQSDMDEQEGLMHLFEGVVLAIRNPRGHTFLDDSPERSLEYIGLLSLLANRLEESKRIK